VAADAADGAFVSNTAPGGPRNLGVRKDCRKKREEKFDREELGALELLRHVHLVCPYERRCRRW